MTATCRVCGAELAEKLRPVGRSPALRWRPNGREVVALPSLLGAATA
jgi:hypothetical protein